MNLVTLPMHDAGVRALPSRPSISIGAEGLLRLNYKHPDPTLIYNAMEKERTANTRGTLESGDSERLTWLAESGRRMIRLGDRWQVSPLSPVPGGPPWEAPWYPSLRQAIDAARRGS